jgi:TRAP-type C4-dicarboxylate transport system permease small subunit
VADDSRLEAFFVAVPRAIVGAAIFLAIGINFANIIGRYVFLSPIIWAEEILIFIMIWCVFIGAVLVTWEGRHIKMDLLSVLMPSPLKEIVNLVGAVLFVGVCGFVVVQSWQVTALMNRLDQRSVVAEIPMMIPHLALLLGFSGMLIAVILRFRSYVTNAFGSETEATTKQVTETFGIFEGAEQVERPKT